MPNKMKQVSSWHFSFVLSFSKFIHAGITVLVEHRISWNIDWSIMWRVWRRREYCPSQSVKLVQVNYSSDGTWLIQTVARRCRHRDFLSILPIHACLTVDARATSFVMRVYVCRAALVYTCAWHPWKNETQVQWQVILGRSMWWALVAADILPPSTIKCTCGVFKIHYEVK
jgi:hypothetical protein